MSRIAFILAPDIHASTLAAQKFGWERLSASRYTNAHGQDIRFARTPGELTLHEFPTDIYREDHWPELSEEGDKGWKWDANQHANFQEMVDDGRIRLLNEPGAMPDAEA